MYLNWLINNTLEAQVSGNTVLCDTLRSLPTPGASGGDLALFGFDAIVGTAKLSAPRSQNPRNDKYAGERGRNNATLVH